MKRYTLFTQLIVSFFCTNIIGMQPITYQQATTDHIQAMVTVLEKHASADRTKIVILPKLFRSTAIEQDIAQKKLYCATIALPKEVIAFKKLFLICNEQEYNDIATNEIRCANTSTHVKTQAFNVDNSTLLTNAYTAPQYSFHNSACIYFGGDYTVPTYRDRRINSTLTSYAFNQIQNDTIATIKNNNFSNIVLFYGLTKANAGETDTGVDRTPSIIRAFSKFLKQITTDIDDTAVPNTILKNNIITHRSYKAFMPTFNLESTQCIPLPDDQAVPGYGNVLIFPLYNNNKK